MIFRDEIESALEVYYSVSSFEIDPYLRVGLFYFIAVEAWQDCMFKLDIHFYNLLEVGRVYSRSTC